MLSEEAVDEALDDDEEEAAPLHPAIKMCIRDSIMMVRFPSSSAEERCV